MVSGGVVCVVEWTLVVCGGVVYGGVVCGGVVYGGVVCGGVVCGGVIVRWSGFWWFVV